MPKLPRYEYTGPIDCTVAPDISHLKGKSVVITGGANGIGEAYVRAFVEAGAFVTFSDISVSYGSKLSDELGRYISRFTLTTADPGSGATFVECDINNWDDQLRMFEKAVSSSPNKSCDIVIANAGISRSSGNEDSLFALGDPTQPPTKPALKILNTNLNGTLFTWKLAVHYFRKQPDDDLHDRCFTVMGSMAHFVDSPGNWEYTCSKYALRGLIRTARRSSWDQGIRINLVAPYFIESSIRTPEIEKHLRSKGVDFGLVEDCVRATTLLACDRSINGHSIIVVPRSSIKEGFADAALDDFIEPDHYSAMQKAVLNLHHGHWKEEGTVQYDR